MPARNERGRGGGYLVVFVVESVVGVQQRVSCRIHRHECQDGGDQENDQAEAAPKDDLKHVVFRVHFACRVFVFGAVVFAKVML